MNILYFGIYSKGKEYPRNDNLIRALRLQGATVTEAHCELAGSFLERFKVARRPFQAFSFVAGLITSFILLTRKLMIVPEVDVLIVGHPGYFHIHLAWLLRLFFKRNALLVYDSFIPLHEALVEDRLLLEPLGVLGWLLRRFERSCCRCADICLVDTAAHAQYLVKTYGLSAEKVSRIFVGPTISRPALRPRIAPGNSFKIIFPSGRSLFLRYCKP